MPIYEYNCDKCAHHFEVLIRNNGDVPDRCPKCGKGKPVKALSAFAVAAATHKHGDAMPCAHCPSAAPGGGCASGACHFDD
jgi:putative FmdB family regulatory protein